MMLNVYDYHDEPSTLAKSDVPPEFRFDYDSVDDAIEYIRERITGEDISVEFEAIARVFADQFSKCHTRVATYGDECAIYPLGRDKINQWAVHLKVDEGSINGYCVRYTRHTDFCKDESPFEHNQTKPNFVRNLIIRGLHVLALEEIND